MRQIWIAILAVVWGGLAWADGTISADAARRAALDGEVTLVDIRTPQEWEKTGVPDAAHLLNLHEEGFVSRLIELYEAHPDRPLAMICATGGRSSYVTQALTARGFDRFVNVSEGMLGSSTGPGWLARGLPVRTPDAPRVIE